MNNIFKDTIDAIMDMLERIVTIYIAMLYVAAYILLVLLIGVSGLLIVLGWLIEWYVPLIAFMALGIWIFLMMRLMEADI